MAKNGINKCIIMGRLGQDPDVRYMPNGDAVATCSLATSESYKDKNTGQAVEKTEWHRVVFFGKLAEIVGEYVRKGSQIYVEGKLKTRKWQDQQGQDKYTTEVVVDSFDGVMQMIGGKNEQASQGANNAAPQQQGGFAQQQGQPQPQPQQQGGYQQSQPQYAPQQQGGFAQQQGQPQPQQQGGFNQNGGYAPQQ